MADKVIELVNRYDFQEQVLKSKEPVLVDFYGERCQFSKHLAPKLEELCKEYSGRVRFVKVDVASADLLDADWKIKRTPTTILFMNGKPVRRWTNEQNADTYRRQFDSMLAQIWA